MRFFTLSAFVLVLALPMTTWGNDTLFSVGLGLDYATGKYGSGTTTDTVSAPLTIMLTPTDRLDLGLVIPFLYQSNGLSTAFGRYRFRNGRTASGANGQGRSQVRSDSDIMKSRSGVGDISFEAGYVVVDEGAAVPRIRPLVAVQFPTGDVSKGLGTGVFAGGPGLGLSKWLGDCRVHAEAIYYFQSSSSEFDLQDFLSYEAGIGLQLTDRLHPSFLILGATRPSKTSGTMTEARLKFSYRLTGRATLDGYVATGLTNASSDLGTGFSVSYDF